MELSTLLSLCSFIFLIAFDRRALAGDAETWSDILPNTKMPKSLLDILQPSGKSIDTKNPDFGVGKTVLNLNDDKLGLGSAFPTAGKDSYATITRKGPKKTPPRGVTTFFLEKALRPGNKMTLFFPESATPPAKFLPGGSIGPDQLQGTLERFSIHPDSVEARAASETVNDCAAPGVRGETKRCAASLRSLVEFAVGRLGRSVEVFATEAVNKAAEVRILGGVRKIGEKSVVCHKQNYVYAVFYCHEVHATRAYAVSLVGADGSKAEAVAVCHTDTRYWSAELMAFRVLGVKPGTVPVCHFLPRDTLVWVPK